MKVVMNECDGCFAFDMVAETMQEAALLVRFAANATGEFQSLASYASKAGDFTGNLVIGKRRNANDRVPKAR